MNRSLPLVLVALAACTPDPPTEIVVVVDTDLGVPAEVGGIEIDVRMPSGRVETRSTVLTSRAVLPVTLGVAHREGALGPVRIEARAVRSGVVAVRKSVSLSLVTGRSLLVWMVLSRDCAGVDCPSATCEAGACRDEALRPDEIIDYNGMIPTLSVDGGQPPPDGAMPFDGGGPPDAPGADAGDVDAAKCPQVDEVCNNRDDDCDTRIDETFMLSTDTANCGRCGTSCDGPGVVSASCEGGVCVVTCTPGLDDCTPAPGCETSLGTTTNCMACDDACMGATPTGTRWACVAAECVFECTMGRGNCDTTLPDCETDLRTDRDHCGMCTRACTPPDRCVGSMCM